MAGGPFDGQRSSADDDQDDRRPGRDDGLEQLLLSAKEAEVAPVPKLAGGGVGALLRLADPPTAIFAGNDLQAFGVYQAAREARLHIPEDLSVVGFDDLPIASWVGPPLTTIRQPLAQMAATAARLVLALARGEEPAQTRVELATALVVRESTAPPSR